MPTDDSAGKVASLLSIADKARLTSGRDFWRTELIESAGIPSILLTDGPHGLRKLADRSPGLESEDSEPATCFPPAAALGCSWDPALVERVAEAIAEEAVAQGVGVVLGPGINIKRSPLCGRNFEYFSEDPLLSGALGAAMVRGLQSRGVGASVKHFAANNQETDRLRVSADIDPRPLREIYLRAFEHVVREARPWTVMCAYNRLNGVYAAHNRWLLTDVLRETWGFDGVVISDWGAVTDRVAAIAAGLDLEMPSTMGRTDVEVVRAINDGSLDETLLDSAVGRMSTLAARVGNRTTASIADPVEHHALAYDAAARSIVLLKNEDDLLPLGTDERLAVIGLFATQPRIQGAGSSRVNPTRVDVALSRIRDLAVYEPIFSAGFAFDGSGKLTDAQRDEAVQAAATAEAVVVFLGLPDSEESEGFDREHLRLPDQQLELLDAVLEANPRTVVVLTHGSVVELPFVGRVPAVLDASLLGQAGGTATADALFGIVNPSGKLAESVPLRLEHSPAFGNFPGESGHVRYGEGILVGYRWYDARALDVCFPFGHGLSYTTFDYGQAVALVESSGDIVVHIQISNLGECAGREVVQVYGGPAHSLVHRAPRELVGFASVELEPGEARGVAIRIPRSNLAYWEVRIDDWRVEGGEYLLYIGSSSRDLRAGTSVQIDEDAVPIPLGLDSSVGELLANPATEPLVRQALVILGISAAEGGGDVVFSDEGMRKMLNYYPINRMLDDPDLPFSREDLKTQIAVANREK